jgi:hypothetical protein
MKTSSAIALGLAILAIGSLDACGSNKPSGQLVLGLKDGPPVSSDNRTISKLEIDVTKIDLTTDGDHQHQSTADAGVAEELDVVAFNAGTGAPLTIDLLRVTTFSQLVANVTIPAGTYGGAEVAVSGARVFFADAPTVAVPLALEGDGHSKAEFDFKFKPAAVVAVGSTSMAVIDFVPVVTKDASGYRLTHDGNDESGEHGNGGEIEVSGTVVSFDAAKNLLTLSGAPGAIDVSAADFKLKGKPATKADIAVGLKAEAEGSFDPKTSLLVAKHVDLH